MFWPTPGPYVVPSVFLWLFIAVPTLMKGYFLYPSPTQEDFRGSVSLKCMLLFDVTYDVWHRESNNYYLTIRMADIVVT